MNWTKEHPETDGWYWMLVPNGRPECVWVHSEVDGWYVDDTEAGAQNPIPIDEIIQFAQWVGPIPEPGPEGAEPKARLSADLRATLFASENPASTSLDQLHDEMANALLRISQLYHAFADGVKKNHEGVKNTEQIMEYIEGLGGATAMAEQALKLYAAVASGELESPPKPQAGAGAPSDAREAEAFRGGAVWGLGFNGLERKDRDGSIPAAFATWKRNREVASGAPDATKGAAA